jgi:hypothetical protein
MYLLHLQLGKKRFPFSCFRYSSLWLRFCGGGNIGPALEHGGAYPRGRLTLPGVFLKHLLLLRVFGGCAGDLKLFLAEVLGLYVTAKTSGDIFV